MAAITQAQKRKIFAVARELGLDNDLLHAVAYGLTQKEHISDLSKTEAALVIDDLERRANRSRDIQLPGGRRVALATKEQQWLIWKLVADLGWDDNPKRLEGFCKKYAGVDNPQWLTRAQAWRVIEGLKALAGRMTASGT